MSDDKDGRYFAEKRKARDLEIERDYALMELNAVKYELQLSTARCKEQKQILANARAVLFTLEEHWNNPDYDEHHQIKKVIGQINALLQRNDTISEASEI